MNAKDIIALARDLKRTRHTNDPYQLAEQFGIVVMHRNSTIRNFTAQTTKIDGYPTIISINSAYGAHSQKILCAHELGHALLHQNYVNHFAVTSRNITQNTEWEANLFAIALLAEDDIDETLTVPLADMNNYLLKSIIDYNIRKSTT